jgi:serine/threonine-protein phosphatase 2B catalytic subunit
MHRWDGPASFPYVITIFSAPNYCGYYENKASVLIIDKGNLSLKQYDESETPYRLPDNMDVFSWSIPFLAEKVVSMLYTIVRKGCNDGDEDEDDVDVNKLLNKNGQMTEEEKKFSRGLIMKKKVKSVARMSKMFTTLR